MLPRFTVHGFEAFIRPTRTRFPFRYGIASMTDVPHLLLRARIAFQGREVVGLASEGLPPKWFTKNPATTFAEDLPGMLTVTGHAVRTGLSVGANEQTFFTFWQALYQTQARWSKAHQIPPLLANLGVSLVERAVVDALCRALQQPLHQLLRDNALALELGAVRPELAGSAPAVWLPPRPAGEILVRHTVGLTDPLTPDELPGAERVDDGLPQDLQSSIRAYGLRGFKIKLAGEAARDVDRLAQLVPLLLRETGGDFLVTLDGNENYPDFKAFRDFWEALAAERALQGFPERIVVVEQPVHRDHALGGNAGRALEDWPGHPALIIDESDGALDDLPRALALGYSGTSHKNCKGIVKGIANACLLAQRRSQGLPAVLTGEDLCNLGPVALLQDLAMMAVLGVPHVERNGHHYFRGLSMWPEDWQAATLHAHPDLYQSEPAGLVRVRIEHGKMALNTVNRAPFGCGWLPDPAQAGFERKELD